MNELARGCYAAAPIKKGEIITRDKVFFAMPCTEGQTTSGQYQDTMVASRDYSVNEGIFEERKVSITNNFRSVIHDVKGLLYEAKVVIPKDFDLEISHHYGMLCEHWSYANIFLMIPVFTDCFHITFSKCSHNKYEACKH